MSYLMDSEISLQDREKLILEYTHDNGYALVKHLVIHMKSITTRGVSKENIKTMIQRLERHGLIGSTVHKQVENNQKIYALTAKGLEYLGKSRSEITAYERRHKQINFRQLEHFWLARDLEKAILRDVDRAGIYSAETINEFSDETGKLSVKTCNLRSDAEIRILRKGFERLVMRVEVDTGTQSITSILKSKLDNYRKYFQNSRMLTEYQTWPVYILFVTNRFGNILSKHARHELIPYLLFLPLRKLSTTFIDMKFQQDLDGGRNRSELRKELRRMAHVDISDDSVIEVQKPGEKWLIHNQSHHEKYLIGRYDNRYLFVQDLSDIFTDSDRKSVV